MNLVAYSDSESDGETEPTPAPKAAARTGPKKLVNPGTHKVTINLPSVQAEKDDIQRDAPPAKRARIGGGLNINAFLPAPKRPAGGLGKGVNLKTGAEAAFERAPKTFEVEGEKQDIKDVIAELRARPSQAVSEEKTGNGEKTDSLASAPKEMKMVGSAMKFKPLSVSRNAQKKKKKPPPSKAAESAPAATIDQATQGAASANVPAKAKVSLFSIGQEQTQPSLGAGYSFFAEDEVDDEEEEQVVEAVEEQTFETTPSAQTGHQTLNSITKDMNLSDADMRQLFGRQAGKGGKMPDLSNMKVVNFNMDDEYRANNELIAKGEVISHNPVRAIAPGKHSLKQLVNAAATQKEALEEHFAKGRSNQKETSSRYGWS
ncbi:Mitotic checkpoint protein PRCC [Venturia nashicola]|uniref:Mitotic checkpoint protein PRCC n=1 Tax=Venturia nashicola TaxID=86259 RepID=A0A4Z1NPL2_9PEZI|nr:Mitotic checkpoint protein PRCC [Venturia nashicola]TLD20960.1 Mitotic checkpoint protein PRCC [Venturia nashicola]